jgi:hypothetical protein
VLEPILPLFAENPLEDSSSLLQVHEPRANLNTDRHRQIIPGESGPTLKELPVLPVSESLGANSHRGGGLWERK